MVSIGTLFVVVVILVVAALALRNMRRTGELAEKLAEHQLEDRESMEIIRGLRQGLDQERQERLRAQQRAEKAEQKAIMEATRQLRARMDDYLKELGEAGTWPGDGIRRVK